MGLDEELDKILSIAPQYDYQGEHVNDGQFEGELVAFVIRNHEAILAALRGRPVSGLIVDGYPDVRVWCHNCTEPTEHSMAGMELVCQVCFSIACSFHPKERTAEEVQQWLKEKSDRRTLPEQGREERPVDIGDLLKMKAAVEAKAYAAGWAEALVDIKEFLASKQGRYGEFPEYDTKTLLDEIDSALQPSAPKEKE